MPNDFKQGDAVTVRGTVVRTRDGRAEIQLRDGQLLRVPVGDAEPAPAEGKAVQEPSEHKAVTRAPENKATRPKQNAGGGPNSGGKQRA